MQSNIDESQRIISQNLIKHNSLILAYYNFLKLNKSLFWAPLCQDSGRNDPDDPQFYISQRVGRS
jgi:hypothetical protein